MGFIENIQKKIEKNAIKIQDISWTDKEGNIHTEDIVIKKSNLPLIGDWARIYPVLNENGKPNWINIIFGGKKNLIKLIIVLGIVAMILLAFREFFTNYNALKEVCEPIIQSKNILS